MTTVLHLVRHGDAGDRSTWQGDDSLRPLSPKGLAQAEIIAERLSTRPLARLVSSPAVRCWATLDPLAARTGRELEEADFLIEGADPSSAFVELIGLVDASDNGEVVACTHGDVLQGIVELLVDAGTSIEGPVRLSKGVTVDLVIDGERVTALSSVRAR